MCNYVLMHAHIYVHAVIANCQERESIKGENKYYSQSILWYFTFYIYLLIHLDLCVHVDGYDSEIMMGNGFSNS